MLVRTLALALTGVRVSGCAHACTILYTRDCASVHLHITLNVSIRPHIRVLVHVCVDWAWGGPVLVLGAANSPLRVLSTV